ncbi:MAG: phosphatidate cytidylyltransferase [Methyloceanibacter sp.]
MTSSPPSHDQSSEPEPKASPELWRRIGSAVFLAALTLAALVISPWTFLILVIASATILFWEWGAATRATGGDATTIIQVASVTATVIFVAVHKFELAAIVFGATVLTLFISGYQKKTPREARLDAGGLIYVALPAASLVWLRSDPSHGATASYGLTAILFVLLVSWTTDTASYVGGRTFGGPKFAPTISPKKTWSGFVIGIVTPMLVGVLFAFYLGNSSPVALAVVALVLAFACQMGDLLESAVKRSLGIKDMSQLIPGHGGFFDRIDSLLMAAVVAALIALRNPAFPGAGLLIW